MSLTTPEQSKLPDVGTNLPYFIERYIAIRDRKEEIKKRHQAELEPLNTALNMLELAFLNHFNTTKSDNAAVKGVGTAYRSPKRSAVIENADEFRRHVIGSEAWHLLDWRANAPAVEAAINEAGSDIPGIKFSVEARVGIRRA